MLVMMSMVQWKRVMGNSCSRLTRPREEILETSESWFFLNVILAHALSSKFRQLDKTHHFFNCSMRF